MSSAWALVIRQSLRAPRLRALAWAAALSSAVILTVLLVWAPLTLSAWRAEARLERALAQRSEQGLARLEQARLQALQERLKGLEGRMAYGASKAQLLQQVEALARSRGLSVQARSARTEGSYHQIDLTMRGSYVAQRGFLTGLDGLPSLFQVRSLRLAAVDGSVRADLRLLAPVGAAP